MPRIRRQNLPRDLWKHLLQRIKDRNISVDQLGLLADWLATEPEVPQEKWFKRFPGVIVCGEGEFIRTFLQPQQVKNWINHIAAEPRNRKASSKAH